MSKIDDGGPAFPVAVEHMHPDGSQHLQEWGGMTLRDYFAASVLPQVMNSADTCFREGKTEESPSIDEYTRDAYRIADSMLAARKRPV